MPSIYNPILKIINHIPIFQWIKPRRRIIQHILAKQNIMSIRDTFEITHMNTFSGATQFVNLAATSALTSSPSSQSTSSVDLKRAKP